MFAISLFAVCCILVPDSAFASLSDYVKLEHDTGDVLKPKQPILAERNGRFIRFDAKDTEIELELGVSVPFLKIPLHTAFNGGHHDNRVTVNTAGVLVGASLLLTSLLLVPLILPGQSEPHARSDKESKQWDLLSEVNGVLKQYQLDMHGCSKKAVCEMVRGVSEATADGPLSILLDNAINSDAIKNSLGNVTGMEAVQAGRRGTCEATYSNCFLNRRHLALLPRLLGA